MATFLSTLSELERRYEELDHIMADPNVRPIQPSSRSSAVNVPNWMKSLPPIASFARSNNQSTKPTL
jgi:hypothetical protein